MKSLGWEERRERKEKGENWRKERAKKKVAVWVKVISSSVETVQPREPSICQDILSKNTVFGGVRSKCHY